MTRGSFRFMLWVASGQTIASALLALMAWRFGGAGSDLPAFFVAASVSVLGAIYLGYLIRVRRNDAAFWDDEEARREDWDRRGRSL